MARVAAREAAREAAEKAAFNPRCLRGTLAARQIAHVTFARACGLDRTFVSQILTGSRVPGALARIKIARGIAALGLEEELPHAIQCEAARAIYTTGDSSAA